MNKISFIFKNKIHTVDFDRTTFNPTSTLLEFIRTGLHAKGTKEGCNEGDCGACTVVIIEKKNKKINYQAINSCVTFLPSIHQKQILTIEDIGNIENLHPIQQIIVNKHASQCGFCTPGFIMAFFAQKANNINSSKEQLIEAVAGNLCRCTGYQTIRTSAEEIEKIDNINIFNKYANEKLLDEINNNKEINIKKDKSHYHIPATFKQAVALKQKYPEATICNGSTDLTLKVTKLQKNIPKIIDIANISEIQKIETEKNYYIIGAGTKIENLYQFAKHKLPAIAEILIVFGSKQIRNRATIGGNIASASPIGDIIPTLFAHKAKITITGKNKKIVKIEDFIINYRKTILEKNEIIENIIIPKPENNEIIKTYKISKRTKLDISTVSASFNFNIKNNIINNNILAFGGMAEMTKRAKKTENFLLGKNFTEKNIREASKILKSEFSPITDARASKEARTIMAKNLLMKFYADNTNKTS